MLRKKGGEAMLLSGSTRSPSIPNGVLAWFEGDVFTLNLKGRLLDQDKEPVDIPEGATLTLRVYNERREVIKEFERIPDENGNITIDIDEETTALFPWGKYKGQMIYTDANRRTTIGVYDIVVGDIEHHKHNKYSVNAEFMGWISRGVYHAEVDPRGHLLLHMTDGKILDTGEVGTSGAGGIGWYYTPTVSKDGILTWTPSDPDMPAAESANVQGPAGKDGEPGKDGADGGYYTPSVSAEGLLTWSGSKAEMPAPDQVNIKGPPGKDGTSVTVESVTTSEEPGGINEVTFSGGAKLQVRNGLNGSGGGTGGEDGGYYRPSVAADGNLSWTGSKADMPPVEGTNIKGPKGDRGENGEPGPQGPPGSDATVSAANVAAAIGAMDKGQATAAREGLGALASEPKTIPQSDDLNNYKEVGYYVHSYYHTSETLLNCPTNGVPFGMQVTDTGVGVRQTICSSPPGLLNKTFIRNYHSGSKVWGEWFEEYSTANKPTPADIGAIPDTPGTVTTEKLADGAVTAAKLAANAVKLHFRDTEVAVSAFKADESYEDYPYRAAVALEGALASMVPEVILDVEDAVGGNIAPVAKSYDGGIYLYAAEIPTKALVIPTILLWRTSAEGSGGGAVGPQVPPGSDAEVTPANVGAAIGEMTTAQKTVVRESLDVWTDAYRAATYSGADLSKVFGSEEALHEAVAEGDFSNIHIGDYFPITLSGSFHDAAAGEDKTLNANVKMEVAAINPYLRHGDKELTAQHILLCSRDCLPPTLQYRSENGTWYDETAVNPWLGSALFATLNDAENGIVKLVENSALGAYLFKGPNNKGMRAILPTMAAGASSPSTWAWSDRGKLFLPEEREVCGSIAWSNTSSYNAGNLYNQWPIFTGSARHIIKGAGDGGGRCSWWMETASAAASFAIVGSTGNPTSSTAANTSIRAPLCFLFT